jgi:hypothetical protein
VVTESAGVCAREWGERDEVKIVLCALVEAEREHDLELLCQDAEFGQVAAVIVEGDGQSKVVCLFDREVGRCKKLLQQDDLGALAGGLA